jgi:hypothetical protein
LGTSVAALTAAFAGPGEKAKGADHEHRREPATAPASPGVVPCTRSLISQQVIQQLPSGVELRIGPQAKVTAAARDAAAARTIRISREV